MRDYAVICSCGHHASRPTLGQAASELTRHLSANTDDNHWVTIHQWQMRPPRTESPSQRSHRHRRNVKD